ncbi:hypothetical protein ALP82_200220 [Pseudomonas savastanoi pv. fraxini]|uniref:Uncharacterized protein n=1 Tax=Pseudomonas savastanoi pv. nerii TaxID=360921 RepID=A0A3M5PYB4_PSESS|nr:hypothetical protein ALR00_00464 [Pseudomonas savastanoi pv. retacarpa]RML70226.1 hypothetical protein ALQ90_200044 [Pseudomonas savastanoi pv. savastanoi]RMR64861.1 hypothetical protein ALP82_200220 [Pseudomonas savastanoi pv. fraxini]RMT76164.1 hypothetical protein ALP42_200057 [Pseudomonas savastanoi pv. nerii]RMP50933.1 hypothetical protein ALQ22_200102 [Pseudomonas savastanoi pv. retacarpa]
MRCNAVKVDTLFCQCIEFAIVGLRINSPEPRATDVGQAWAKPIAQKPEQAEHYIAIGSIVGHDLRGLQFGLLL